VSTAVADPVAPPQAKQRETHIRPFAPADAAGVANLLTRAFSHSDKPASEETAAYLRRVYLDYPGYDPDIASRVMQRDDGSIVGFAGVVATRFHLSSQTLRAALTSSLAVDEAAGDPTLAARLLRDVQGGPQDMVLADRSNQASTNLARLLKTEIIEGYSFDWLRVLRPAGFTIAALASRVGPARLLAPLVAPFDSRFAAHAAQSDTAHWAAASFARSSRNFTDRHASTDDLLDLIPQFVDAFPLRPDWSRDELRHILDDVARKQTIGDYAARIVLTPTGTPAGLFLLHFRTRQVAQVAQILATRGREGAVIDRAIAFAAEQGAVAIRGRSTPNLTPALMERRAVFLPDLSTTVYSRNPDIARHFREGTAFFTGLAGENWMRLNGDRF
jgi:hypothetical protein